MAELQEIVSCLERWAPKSWQESYDNSGLLVGDPQQAVSAVLVTLDVTEEVIQEAIEKNCQAIIAHHPILFKGVKSLSGNDYVSKVLRLAIKHDIALYAFHTNLDHAGTGVSYEMARRLDLQSIRVLDPQRGRLKKLEVYVPAANKEGVLKALHDAGAGEIGNYSQCSFQSVGQGTFLPLDGAQPVVGRINHREEVQEVKLEVIFPSHLEAPIMRALFQSHPYEEVAYYILSLDNLNQEVGAGAWGEWENPKPISEVLGLLKDVFKVPVVRHTRLVRDTIKRVAVCGGAGLFLLPKAIAKQADLFISADFKYHDFFEANDRIIVADVGHYESEQFTKDLIVTYLSKNFTNFAIHLSERQTNPINYFV